LSFIFDLLKNSETFDMSTGNNTFK